MLSGGHATVEKYVNCNKCFNVHSTTASLVFTDSVYSNLATHHITELLLLLVVVMVVVM